MTRLARRLAVVDAAGLVAVGLAAWAASRQGLPALVPSLVLLGVLAGGQSVLVPLRVGGRRVDIAGLVDAGVVLGLALLQPAWVVLAVGAVALGQQLLTGRYRWDRVVFNTANQVVAAGVPAFLVWLLPPGPLAVRASVLLAAGVLMSVLNDVMISAVVSAAGDEPLLPVLRGDLPLTLLGSLASSGLAVLVVLELAGVPALIALVPVVLVLGTRAYRRRLEGETVADVLPRLAAASGRIAALDEQGAVMEIAERGVELFAATSAEVLLLDWPGTGTRRWVRTGRQQGRWAVAPAHGLGEPEGQDVMRAPLLGGEAELLGEVRLGLGRPADLSDAEQHVLAAYTAASAGAVEHTRTYVQQSRLARVDPLTGLPNRVALGEGLEQLLPAVLDRKQLTAGDQAPAAVVLIGLDHFRQVNDTIGRDEGDELLRAVGRRLASATRTGDLVSRVGGDEFCLVLPHVRDAAHARALAEQVLASFAGLVTPGGLDLPVLASAGVALTPADGTDLDVLLRRARLALATARATSAPVAVFDEGMDVRSTERTQLVAELVAGLRRGEVGVAFQPRVEVATGAVGEVEAVPVWDHPGLGRVPAVRLEQLAAAAPVGLDLVLFVLDAAVEQAVRWRGATSVAPSVAVTVSPRCLLSPTFAGDVAFRLVKHGLPGASLVLQISERPDGAWGALTAATVRSLQGVGVRVAYDRFGGRSTSLRDLATAEVDQLTLDGRLVGDAAHDDAARAVVAGAVAVAKERGVPVSAAGVDSADDHAMAERLGVGSVQGRMHGEPVGAEAMLALLLRRGA